MGLVSLLFQALALIAQCSAGSFYGSTFAISQQ
jgi:hypothetical protein